MTRARTPFRQVDIGRAIRAIEKAGKTVSRVELDHNGALVLVCQAEETKDRAKGLDLVAIARGEDGAKGKRAGGR
ncbi:MAG TPA: hypothetical protein VIL70_07445 [Chthoniobacterales bacterium]